MKTKALTVADANDYCKMAFSLLLQLEEEEKRDLSGKDWGTTALRAQFIYFQGKLNDSIKLDNCDPLSGRLEVPELSPGGVMVFSEFCMWVHTTLLRDKLKKTLH